MRTWENLGVNLCNLNENEYLIITNYKALLVIEELRTHFLD